MFSVIRRAPALARPQICRHLASTIRRACISTLVSDRLVSTDLLDLSGQKQRDCHTTSVDSASEQSVRLSYKHEKPFPSSTRGYLYWHTPHPEHLAAGEIRFRLAPKGIDDPMAAFATGQDLYVSEETPWRVWAVAAARNRTQRALAEILVRDGVLPQRALDEWQHRALSPRPWTSVLLQLDQPFVCDLGDAINLYVADGLNLHRVVIKSLLRDRRRAEGDIGYVYTGRILCRFESGVTAGGNAVVQIRMLKALSSITSRVPRYDGYVPIPKAGELLREAGGAPAQMHLTAQCAALAMFLRDMPNAGYIGPLVGESVGRGKRKRVVEHIVPATLEQADFIDLSGAQKPVVYISGERQALRYSRGGIPPFPSGTHGFLYTPGDLNGDRSVRSRTLRFRITKDWDPSSFATGHDLLDMRGEPWTPW